MVPVPVFNEHFADNVAVFVRDLRLYLTGDTERMERPRYFYFLSVNFFDLAHCQTIIRSLFDLVHADCPALERFGPATGAQVAAAGITQAENCKWELVIVRPNIEHNMLGVIVGRGGVDELGATLWGQTELSVYDDSMHGIWGMSYKYNERAIVFNHKNLIRMWDVAYDGYNGGKDCTSVNWTHEEVGLSTQSQIPRAHSKTDAITNAIDGHLFHFDFFIATNGGRLGRPL